MAKETLGYVRLEWTCSNCGTRNPGPQKTCTSCGAPQPEDVQFEQPAQEELIKDKAEIERAKLGPDVHCYYCGSRNAADATTCSQCGADLSQATARSSGRVIGAHRTGPAAKVNCPACGTPNEANAPKCVQCGASLARPEPATAPPIKKLARKGGVGLVIAILAVLILCVGAVTLVFLSNRTQDIVGTVEQVAWTRTIAVEGLAPVKHEAWQNEIPTQAVVGTCTQKIHHTQDEPADNAQEVCGTPYTVDKGSGYGQVAQDCQYQVYADWCQYTVDEWQQVDEAALSGRDLNPAWPVLQLKANQREGPHQENYEILFTTEKETYSYRTGDSAEFARYQPGSRWILKVNTFGSVISTESTAQ